MTPKVPNTHAPDRKGLPLCGQIGGKVVTVGATCKKCARIRAGGYGRSVSKLFAFPVGNRLR